MRLAFYAVLTKNWRGFLHASDGAITVEKTVLLAAGVGLTLSLMSTVSTALNTQGQILANTIRYSPYGKFLSAELIASNTSEGYSLFLYRIRTSSGEVLTMEYEYDNGRVTETWLDSTGGKVEPGSEPEGTPDFMAPD